MNNPLLLLNETHHPYWQDIIKSYFKANGFVKHQIDSFNEFIEVSIQKILNEIGAIEIITNKESRGGEATYIIEFGNISIKKPVIREHDGTTNVLYPQEARNRNLTYHSSLYCDIKVKTIKNGEETFKISKEQLGYIPIMVRSKFCLLYGKTEKECKELGECIYDEGGYFIVNGNEKAIIAQERMPNNIVYCSYKKPPFKIIWQAEIRSQFEYHIKTTSTFYIKIFAKGSRTAINNNPTFIDIDGIRGQITYIKVDIPIVFIFYALGFTSKNEIIDIISNSKIPLDSSSEEEYFKNILKFLRCSFDEAAEIIKEENGEVELDKSELQDFCLDYIGKKGSTIYGSKAERVKYATQIINRELLPHLNLEYENIFKPDLQITKTKAHFIGYIINKLYISYLGIVKENDRDHLANKRLDLTGNLLTSLFKGIFKRLYKEAKVNLTKSIEANNSFDLMNNIKSKSITNDIKYALSTGNWGRQTGGTPPKTGVAQQLNRLTFSSGLSHLRRLNTPLNREGKQPKPRQLHSTNWGYVCLCETPEGAGCLKSQTPILLSNGELIPIKDLEHNYKEYSIYSTDIETRKIEPTNIVAFQNHDTEKYGNKVLKITTISGRSIVLTTDHPFAVPGDTFIEAGNIKIGDRVLIYPTSINQLHDEVADKIILDKEMYINSIKKSGLVQNKTIEKDIAELEKAGLMPLINNDKRLATLAGLIGYCDTAGYITTSSEFSMGCEEDMESIKNAVYSIGFGTTSEGKCSSSRTFSIGFGTTSEGKCRRTINKTIWVISLSSNLSRLLIALGTMVGKKTTQPSKVPDFIKYCNLRVKASYLSALFGGNGEALNYVEKTSSNRKSSRWQISSPGFGNTKIESLTENLELYFNEIKDLLSEFGIKSRKILKQSSIEHEKGLETNVKRIFYIKNDYENLLKFADNIGFKWCKQKQNKMLIISEYIRYLYIYSKSYKTMGIPINYIKWPVFLTDTQADFDTGTLYDQIVKIEHVTSEECPVVMDLTTESDNHTFISNGFVTHNCGLLRNLAITSHVSIGSNKTFMILKRFLDKYVKDKFIETREMITEEVLYKMFLDGAWVVSVDEKMINFLVSKLKNFRRKLMISFDTCVCLDKESKELHIFTGPGRFCRPLLVVENLNLLNEETKNCSWVELLSKGIVEYIDIAEEEEIMIAMDLKQLNKDPTGYSHLEIHPSVILGICASIIPFPDHNQCILYTTPVLMADGTSKMIKDITIGESVVTFDPDTLQRSYSKVEYHMVKETSKKIHKITTISGREMIATFDHKFFTNEGFVQVRYFNSDTKMAINLTNIKLYNDTKIKILDEKKYTDLCNKYKFRESCIKEYITDLKQWFTEIETTKVSILAGIIGYLLTDGCLTKSDKVKIRAHFCHSNEESAYELINDMEYLGFGRSSVIYSNKTSIFGKNTDEEKEITQKVYTSSYYGRFAVLLECLGVTTGKRTIQDSIIPEFILNGSKEIQRSFLSGIFGGDGSKIRFNQHKLNGSGQITLNTLSMTKDLDHIDSLKTFIQNIRIMLEQFNIVTNYIHVFDGKYGKMTVHLGFEQKTENIIKFYEEIGYKYDNLKNQELLMQRKFVSIITQIREDIDNNLSYNELMKKYNKNYKEISHIKENYKKGIEIHERKNFKDFMCVNDFISKCELENNTLYVPIDKIEDFTDCNIIADITVESKNHTFMANNFLIHNSPRNIYQSSMGKQAMGIYASNFNERFDTLAHILHYPQKPLVTTTFMKYMRSEELPAGINAIVAIACYGGYNQEDSIIVNKGALDRGIFRSTFFKTYVDQEKEIVRVGGLMEQFEIPNRGDTKGIQHGNYGKLGIDGVIEPGSRVIENDIIIGKTTPIATSKQEISQMKKFKKRDVSTSMRQNEAGVIDKVLVTTNSDGFKYSKVKIRSSRIPEVGDKLASLTENHEILTLRDGWKNIKKITLEDKVATLKDGKLVYDYPTEVYAYEDYEGDMYEISNTSIDLKASGCHKMFVSKRYGKKKIFQPHAFELARDIVGERRKYKKDAEWECPEYYFSLPSCEWGNQRKILPEIHFDTPEKMNAWLLFLGIFIADGWVTEHNTGICYCKQSVKDVLYTEIDKLGFTWTENVKEYPFHNLNISTKQLAIYLKTYTPDGALTKFLPEWCFQLSKEQTRTLLHGMMLGNGYIQNNCHFYYTSSDKLADQVSQLALHAGWAAHNRLRSEGLEEYTTKDKVCHSNHPRWMITIIKTKLEPEINNASKQNAQIEIYTKHVKCPVYCISVPSEVFYVRRNGKSCWTGNSRHGLIKRVSISSINP
jgi:DNA-directed RNA polymerase beta subunit